MRILIVSKYFPPENSIASLRPYSWAKYWAAAGHDVTVLTTPKDTSADTALSMAYNGFKVKEADFHPLYYKLKKVYKASGSNSTRTVLNTTATTPDFAVAPSYIKQQFKRINEFRLKRGVFVAIRMPDNMDFWIPKAIQWAKKQEKWDLVVSSHSPYSSHVIAYNIKKNGLAGKWIADFRDLWTDNHIYKGVFPFTLVEQYLERKLMKKADVITTVSAPLRDTLAAKYGEERVHVIENGFDPSDVETLPKSFAFPPDGKKRLIYAGTIYKEKQDPSPLFAAIALLAKEEQYSAILRDLEVSFYGANVEVIEELISKHEVSRYVKIGGFVDRNMVLQMQRDADGLIFLEFGGGKVEGILTGKLFEYLFSGTEIWGIGVESFSAPGKLIQAANAGTLFGENITAIKEALVELLSNPTKKKPIVNLHIIDRYNRKELAYKLLSLAAIK